MTPDGGDLYHRERRARDLDLFRFWVFPGKLLVVGFLQILQISGGGEKMKENQHSFFYRFPHTTSNVDA